MRTFNLIFQQKKWHYADTQNLRQIQSFSPGLILTFLSPSLPDPDAVISALQADFPNAHIAGCTTGGEIMGNEVLNGQGIAMAFEFSATRVRLESVTQSHGVFSFESGAKLAKNLAADNLAAVLVISDGLIVNGSLLTAGLRSALPTGIPICGGLAGDEDRFVTTKVCGNGPLIPGQIVAIGLYGIHLKVHTRNATGWKAFGPERTVTKSTGNILYEINGKPALDLYKRYLGDEAKNLPASALIYPLKIHPEGTEDLEVIRTVLAIDEEARSLTYAGDIPQGWKARLMIGAVNSLISSVKNAVSDIELTHPHSSAALLVSCIGRKLVMGPNTCHEVEEVKNSLRNIPIAGFYSYGEISSKVVGGASDLHNQTLSITILEEAR